MRKQRYFGLLALGMVLIATGLSSCKTTPKSKVDLPAIQISRAGSSDLNAYGPSYESNPYLEPRTLIRGKLNEFFVVKIVLNLPSKSQVSVAAEMETQDGSEAARPYTKFDFRGFWQNVIVQDPKSEDYNSRMASINRSCLPSFNFTEGAGLTTYYLPFVGKNPMPRPSKVYVQVSVSGQGEPCVFTYDLVEPPAK